MTVVSVHDNISGVGLLLRRWREQRGWSLRQLGERSGVSYVTIQKIEAEIYDPKLSTLEKLARALGVSVRDLLPPDRPGRRTR